MDRVRSGPSRARREATRQSEENGGQQSETTSVTDVSAATGAGEDVISPTVARLKATFNFLNGGGGGGNSGASANGSAKGSPSHGPKSE